MGIVTHLPQQNDQHAFPCHRLLLHSCQRSTEVSTTMGGGRGLVTVLSMEFQMKLLAKLSLFSLALIATFALLMVNNTSSADAHGWRRHCHHHYHHHWRRHCHCHHIHWRCHHRWHRCGHRPHPIQNPDIGVIGGTQCKGRIDGIATAQGLFGLGTARARQLAIADFEAKANTLFGASYGSFSRARGIKWDCNKLALIRAKCVVTAQPCQ